MAYYFEHQEKHIAAPIAYGVLTILVIALVFVMNKVPIRTQTKASQQSRIIASNVSTLSTNGAIIYAVSSSPEKISVSYWDTSTPQEKRIAFDSRDVSSPVERTQHYIPLTALAAKKTYRYLILQNGKESSSGGVFTTYDKNDVGRAQQPLFGKIVTKSITPLPEALVVITFPGAQKQSFAALSDEAGNWIVNIPVLKDSRGKSISLSPEDTVLLTFYSNGERSRVRTTYAYSSPVRTVAIGKNYESDGGVLGSIDTQKLGKNLQVLSPSQGSIIPSRYIRIRGIAKPNSAITLLIQPGSMTLSAQSDDKGQWSVQNTTPLLAGSYALTAQSPSEETLTQVRFSIGKDGEQVLGNATQSPTIIPTAIPTPPVTIAPTNVVPVTPPVTTTPYIPQSGFNTNMLIVGASTLSLLGLLLLLY